MSSLLVHQNVRDLQVRHRRNHLAGRRAVLTGTVTDEILHSLGWFLRSDSSELMKVYKEHSQFRRRLLARLERASRRNCGAPRRRKLK